MRPHTVGEARKIRLPATMERVGGGNRLTVWWGGAEVRWPEKKVETSELKGMLEAALAYVIKLFVSRVLFCSYCSRVLFHVI